MSKLKKKVVKRRAPKAGKLNERQAWAMIELMHEDRRGMCNSVWSLFRKGVITKSMQARMKGTLKAALDKVRASDLTHISAYLFPIVDSLEDEPRVTFARAQQARLRAKRAKR